MSKKIEPEGQTTSDNFLASELEKDFLRTQSGWVGLSDDEHGYLDKKGFKSPAELLRSYRELERAYSSKISLPKDGDKEALDKLYSRLGMPQDSQGFDIDFNEIDKEDGEKFKQICLENNILPNAARALYEWYVANRNEVLQKQELEWTENSVREMEDLKRDWGSNATRNIELMKRGIRLFCEDDALATEIERAIGTRKMMEVFCKLGEAISEDNSVSFGRKQQNEMWDAAEYFREMFNRY